jgi:hypothetical protein
VRRFDYGEERFGRQESVAASGPRHLAMNPWLFVLATVLNTLAAAVVVVYVTLNVAKQGRINGQQGEVPSTSANTRSTVAVANEPAPLIVAPQRIGLTPIGSPDQPLRLDVQKPARLPLQILPTEAAREPFILLLSGMPDGTSLLGATQIGPDTWFLPPGSSNRLEISVPEWSTSVFEMTIVLRRTTGLVAAQTKAWIAVPPPIGPAATVPGTDDTAAKQLLEKANRLLENGDIVAARAVYRRAAEMGNGSAALMLGSTYDPRRLWSIGVIGMKGNKERARQWYSRAAELGHPDAKARLMALGN